uniref:Uncharacterized protein n=1 Tax=Vespula pensylvanica TaxID=30213 RepID=A0A834N199_VESPE|nr:hypothetical protein H0235_017149 [Vespula pensylvanica]
MFRCSSSKLNGRDEFRVVFVDCQIYIVRIFSGRASNSLTRIFNVVEAEGRGYGSGGGGGGGREKFREDRVYQAKLACLRVSQPRVPRERFRWTSRDKLNDIRVAIVGHGTFVTAPGRRVSGGLVKKNRLDSGWKKKEKSSPEGSSVRAASR